MSSPNYNRMEELRARKDGATLVANSGRGMRKGDARFGEYLLDYKFTEKNSFSLNFNKQRDFDKQAWAERMESVTVVIFTEKVDRAYAILDWDHLREMIVKLEHYENKDAN